MRMYFFALSSRPTGPKIRVPLGSPLLSIITAALSSKRTYEPSALRVSFFVLTMTALTTDPFAMLLLGMPRGRTPQSRRRCAEPSLASAENLDAEKLLRTDCQPHENSRQLNHGLSSPPFSSTESNTGARRTISRRVHLLVLLRGRDSPMVTRSPILHSLFSSWAVYFFALMILFP